MAHKEGKSNSVVVKLMTQHAEIPAVRCTPLEALRIFLSYAFKALSSQANKSIKKFKFCAHLSLSPHLLQQG